MSTKYKFWVIWSPSDTHTFNPKKLFPTLDAATEEAQRIMQHSNNPPTLYVLEAINHVVLGPRPVTFDALEHKPVMETYTDRIAEGIARQQENLEWAKP